MNGKVEVMSPQASFVLCDRVFFPWAWVSCSCKYLSRAPEGRVPWEARDGVFFKKLTTRMRI